MKKTNLFAILILVFSISSMQAMNSKLTWKEACEILELSQDSLTDENIKNQFKLLALRFHPDRAQYNKLTPHEARQKFESLKSAVEILLNKHPQSYVSNFLKQFEIKFNGQSGSIKEELDTFLFIGIPYAKAYKVSIYENVDSYQMARESYRTEYLPIYYHAQKAIAGLLIGICVASLWGFYKLNLRASSK